MGKLAGKTIIITGAGGGIGSAITVRCVEEGATVLACDRDQHSLETLDNTVRRDALQIFQVDVSEYAGVKDCVEEGDNFNRRHTTRMSMIKI